MRLVQFLEFAAHEVDFHEVLLARHFPAHQAKTQKHQVGVHHISFAVVANTGDLAALPRLPDLTAVHPEFSGKADQFGEVIQRRVGTRLVQRQEIHQIKVAGVVAADIVVPLEIAAVTVIAVTQIPVAWRDNAVDQAPVVQHWQIESTAVPGNDLWRKLLDAIEEALDDLAFALLRLSQGPHAQILAGAQDAGDDGDTLEIVREKIAAVLCPPLLEGHFRDFAVGQSRIKIVQTPQPRHVGNGFDVEDEDRFHDHAGNTPVDR